MPQIKVEIAWGAGFSTPLASRTYTDVSQWVEGALPLDITYGRADELATADASSCSLTLDNSDGRFTPEKSTSPYFPNVKKGVPIRVSVIYSSGTYVRFTGYVDSWPVVWPDATDSVSSISINCSSRRARLGKTAALDFSPIRYAYYQPSAPQAYWPMDGTYTDPDGTEYFVDVTNTGATAEVGGALIVKTTSSALQPSFTTNPRKGPVDENVDFGMLYFPAFSDVGLVGARGHYVGGGEACRINTAGELTFEMVARFEVPLDGLSLIQLFEITARGYQVITASVANFGIPSQRSVGFAMNLNDETTGVTLSSQASDTVLGYRPDLFALINDGAVHHFAFTLTGGNVGKFYVDGTPLGTLTMPGPYTFDHPITNVVVGADTYKAGVWIGHVAVRDQALTAAQIQAHADGATTQDETIDARLKRLFGYMGVPAAEVSAEPSIALPVGDQTQKGRAPIEVADELAASTIGILYDKRDGTMYMQARNHRYNQTPAFSLSAVEQELGGDLNPVLDDRYLCNYVTVTRTGTDGPVYYWTVPTSVDAYGTYSQALEMVTTSAEEADSVSLAYVKRYAEPKVRISQATVDLLNLSSAQRAAVLNADIGTLFSIIGLPAQAPVSSLPLYLEGYSESITATSHTLTMNTTPGDLYTNVAVVNDPAHNMVNSGITTAP